MIKIGRVIHFYDRIGVAVIELDNDLTVGEKIRFERGGEDIFEQTVDSIQVEHEKRSFAKRGETVGIKTEKEVKSGAEVYKV